MQTPPTNERKRGRPATGKTREKVSLSLPKDLLKTAKKNAVKKKESLSHYVTRAMQAQMEGGLK